MRSYDKLMALNVLDKKSIKSAMFDLMANSCFEILKPVSDFIYSSKKNTIEYTNFCDNVFNIINISIDSMFKCKDKDEFIECIQPPFDYCFDILQKASVLSVDITVDCSCYDGLGVIKENSALIYNKCFKKIRKPRKRKVGKK